MVLVTVKPVPEVRPNGGIGEEPVAKPIWAKTSVPVQSATALISTTGVIRLKCFTFTESSVVGCAE